MSRKEKRRPTVEPAGGAPKPARTIPPGAQPGIVVRAYGKFFDVAPHDGGQILLSTVRGGLKRERRKTDLVAVGDRVLVTDLGQGEGQIERVEPRVRTFGRLARLTDDVEQVILANPDQALFVFAVRAPPPHRRMLDRFLVLAESRGIPALIGVNKIDLDESAPDGGASPAHALFGIYEAPYPVFYLSAVTGEGVPALRQALTGKITAVAGPSGVGKSSLLNLLDPAGARAVGGLSDATGKGRHTT
ncbi:MAG TPA: GTPase RsgA, partial [Thermomicrobiales bacterium]|nr:GTPase RsgA [Thermomicrobiales bacterium]